MINTRLLITTLAIIVLGGISFLLMQYFSSKKEEVIIPKVEKQLPIVKTQVVAYSNVMVDVEQTGRLMSTGRVDLITEVSGKMLAGDINLTTGQSFKKGDILLRIFDEEAKLSLKAAKSRFLSSIAGVLPDLKYDYPDNYSPWLNFFNSIEIEKSLPELPKVSSENEKIYLASRNILNDYFTIQSSETMIRKYVIRAPFNGSYTTVTLEVGAIASPGSRIAKMIRTDILELEVPLNIEEIPYVKKGNHVDVDYRGEVIKGVVDRVSDFVEPSSQSIMVYVKMKNSKAKPLYEGMYMKANFAETELHDVMKIPRQALFNFDEVYVVKDGKLSKRRVKLAKVDEYSAYISGLDVGCTLVIESLINASDQMPVQLMK
ncbi:MAG: efflux RND transporter periplasmic adaptor subunit [Bacteroidales bacterium]|nr:efflux RND transporter periplasmic adaptor subunit [Bacteroidales bacterium]